jgi:hypothetical protein
MLKIRDEHLKSLGEQQADCFRERMLLHLREVFGVEVAGLDDAGLRVLIEKVCVRGEEWGITQEPLVERLIELFVSFEELRRHPLPDWIREIVARRGRSGVRVLLMLEKALQFREGGAASAESGHEAVGSTFYGRVHQAFYDEVKQKHCGVLSSEFMGASGRPRRLAMSSADRTYRRKWRAIAAQMRQSRALPEKEIRSAIGAWAVKDSCPRFPPILLPSKGGQIKKVAIMDSLSIFKKERDTEAVIPQR